MSDKGYSVNLKTVQEMLDFSIVYASSDFETLQVYASDVNRPGLQLAGFFDYFDPRRIQLMGMVETEFLLGKTEEERGVAFEALFSRGIPALILCHGVQHFPECISLAQKYNITLLETAETTSEITAQLIAMLTSYLASRVTRHGVLVEVHGEGVLLIGDSGIGKSETALELIKRGHRLIADDAVEIRRMSRTTLVGSAPKIIRYYMELRGIGVINVRSIYGIGAVKPSERIDLVVNLELWDDNKVYDRLGVDTQHTEILGVELPCMTIPVRPGRNLAVILELAAINNRQKKLGFNNALELAEEHDRAISAGLASIM